MQYSSYRVKWNVWTCGSVEVVHPLSSHAARMSWATLSRVRSAAASSSNNNNSRAALAPCPEPDELHDTWPLTHMHRLLTRWLAELYGLAPCPSTTQSTVGSVTIHVHGFQVSREKTTQQPKEKYVKKNKRNAHHRCCQVSREKPSNQVTVSIFRAREGKQANRSCKNQP